MDQLIVQLLQHLLHLFLLLLLLEKGTLLCFELGLDLSFVSVQSLLLLLNSVQFSLSILVQSFLPFSLSGLFFLSHNFNFFAPSFQSLQQRVNIVLDMFVYIDAIAELIYADVAPDDYICISIALNS